MRRRRPTITPKRPVFLGCEGDSEAGYGQLINDQLRAANLPFHLRVESLAPGAGDPLDRVRRALQRISDRERKRGSFRFRYILMDDDQAAAEPARAAEARRLAVENGISIIWQEPCHEALLLRHFAGREDRNPPTCQIAHRELLAVWPEYRKPMSRAQLAARIDLEAVARAAGVVPQLAEFLRSIGLLR